MAGASEWPIAEVPASRAGLDKAREWLLVAAGALDVPARTAVRLAVVLDEHLSNLLEHDETIGSNDMILVMLERDAAGTCLEVRDPGQPFDPRSLLDLPGRADQGCGLQVICGLADVLTYDQVNGVNHLRVRIEDERGIQTD